MNSSKWRLIVVQSAPTKKRYCLNVDEQIVRRVKSFLARSSRACDSITGLERASKLFFPFFLMGLCGVVSHEMFLCIMPSPCLGMPNEGCHYY